MQKEELAAENLKNMGALTSNCRAKTQGPRSRENPSESNEVHWSTNNRLARLGGNSEFNEVRWSRTKKRKGVEFNSQLGWVVRCWVLSP